MKSLANILATIAVFVTLTRADNTPVYVAPDNVTDVSNALGDCTKGTRAVIHTFIGMLCVLESPEEVMQKFRASGATLDSPAEHKK